MILLSSPLKNDPPPGNYGGEYNFFLEIEIVTTKIVNSKSLKKIYHQLLSTMTVHKFAFTMVLNSLPLMRNNKGVLETTRTSQHKLPMDLTHKLGKTDMINVNGIQLLNTSDFLCHVEYEIILHCYGSRMVSKKLSFVCILLTNRQLRQIISVVF